MKKITSMDNDLRRRLGVLIFTRTVVDEDPDMVMSIMGRCIVLNVIKNWKDDSYEYTVMSPYFDKLIEGEQVPVYDVVIRNINMGTRRKPLRVELFDKFKRQ